MDPVVSLGSVNQVSLPSKQHTGSFLEGRVLDYCSFDAHVHVCTIAPELRKCSRDTAPLKHPLQPGIWLWFRCCWTLWKIPSSLFPSSNIGSLNVSERVIICTCCLKGPQKTKISFLYWCRSEHRLAKTTPPFPGKMFSSGD